MANYEIARVFIDAGSSINVLFKQALEQMGLFERDLQYIETPLFGFFGYVVHSLGQIWLPLSFGEELRRHTILTTFTVVEALYAYNIILGQPTLSAFQAVASSYHQKIMRNEVGEVKGDQ